jgi:pyruvate,water dikinase
VGEHDSGAGQGGRHHRGLNAVSRPPILQFEDPGCEDPQEAGGKGAGLAKMARLGLPVPAGFVIRASVLTDLLDAAGDRQRVLSLLAGAGDGGAAGAARSIQPLIHALPMPAHLSEEIDRALGGLGRKTGVAVRSSASAEDSEVASYAGQQDTFLNVMDTEEVPDRIRDCWSSFFSERALFYRSRRGSLEDLGMAVVIQRQIASDRSGVMFTVDPVRRRRDQMMIEAVWGLGEAVVSGHATPDHYVVSRDGEVKQARISVQEVAMHTGESGGTTQYELTPEQGGARVLSAADLSSLAEMGRLLEAQLGGPQDVEFAFEGDRLYLLQSRPVTA